MAGTVVQTGVQAEAASVISFAEAGLAEAAKTVITINRISQQRSPGVIERGLDCCSIF